MSDQFPQPPADPSGKRSERGDPAEPDANGLVSVGEEPTVGGSQPMAEGGEKYVPV